MDLLQYHDLKYGKASGFKPFSRMAWLRSVETRGQALAARITEKPMVRKVLEMESGDAPQVVYPLRMVHRVDRGAEAPENPEPQGAVPAAEPRPEAEPAPAEPARPPQAPAPVAAAPVDPLRSPLVNKVRALVMRGEVRVHRDRAANEAVDRMSAKAVTKGKDIYLGSRYADVDSAKAQSVLAHELVHVRQMADPERREDLREGEGKAEMEGEAERAEERTLALPSDLREEYDVPAMEHARKPAAGAAAEEPGAPTTFPARPPAPEPVRTAAASWAPEAAPVMPIAVPGYDSAPSMDHPVHAAPAQPPSRPADAGMAMPAMASMEDEEEGHPVQASMLGEAGRFSKLLRQSALAKLRKPTMAKLNTERMTEEMLDRIKEKLIIERERFSK